MYYLNKWKALINESSSRLNRSTRSIVIDLISLNEFWYNFEYYLKYICLCERLCTLDSLFRFGRSHVLSSRLFLSNWRCNLNLLIWPKIRIWACSVAMNKNFMVQPNSLQVQRYQDVWYLPLRNESLQHCGQNNDPSITTIWRIWNKVVIVATATFYILWIIRVFDVGSKWRIVRNFQHFSFLIQLHILVLLNQWWIQFFLINEYFTNSQQCS